jgi:hypothetical protein
VNASTKVAILNSGNVGIGTINPRAKLHVKGGGVTIEDDMGAGRLGFAQTGESDPRIVLYRGGQTCDQTPPGQPDITILRNFPQANASDNCVVWTILKIWAPQESSFPTTPREATLSLVRALDDESKTEFLDVYNNHYSDEQQYGIRMAKKGSGTSFYDFVFDQWDKDQDTKTPLMVLRTDGKVGIGTASPAEKLTVSAGDIGLDEISDPSAPAANRARLYIRDNGSGKTQLVVRFSSGAVQVLATEP